MSAVTEQAETMIAGKWSYMSPEHTTNQQIDHRSDLFSVGVILYLLCTGNLPFAGHDPREIVKKIRAGTYKPLKQVAPDIPASVSDLVHRMLSPNPEDRPRTGQEVVTVLSDFIRSYGIESSSAHLTNLLSQLFEGEANEPSGARELVRTDKPTSDEPRTRIATGSQPSQGGRTSSSFPQANWPIDQSVSLARRSSRQLVAAPAPDVVAPEAPPSRQVPPIKPVAVPQLRTGGSRLVVFLICGGIVVFLVVMYLLIQPV
jgi:serine/threonine protein kinase